MKKQCPDCGGHGHTYESKIRYRMSHSMGGMGMGMQEVYTEMVPKHCITCNGKGRVQYKPTWNSRGIIQR